MSLLTLVQRSARRVGLPVPSVVGTSTDLQTLQLLELANEEGQELSERYQWQAIRKEASFTTVAAETQTTLDACAPGLKYIINDTIWNRDLRRPVFGPLAPQRWQQLKALSFVGPWHQFIVVNNEIHFIPNPTAGQSCYFYYQSKNWVNVHGSTSTTTNQFVNDDDTASFDEDIMVMGLIWRYRAAKGLDYTEDYNRYERRIMDAMAADGSKDVLNAAEVRYDLFPGILVPGGSWPL